MRRWSVLLLFTLLFPLSSSTRLGQANEKADEYVLLVSSKLSSSAVTSDQIIKIFSGRKQTWDDRTPIQLILLPEGSPEMQWLCNRILKMPERLLRRFINQQVYRGTMKRPLEAIDSQSAVELIGRSVGSISPIQLSQLSDSSEEGLESQKTKQLKLN